MGWPSRGFAQPVQAQPVQAPSSSSGGILTLLSPQARHLRTDMGAVGDAGGQAPVVGCPYRSTATSAVAQRLAWWNVTLDG